MNTGLIDTVKTFTMQAVVNRDDWHLEALRAVYEEAFPRCERLNFPSLMDYVEAGKVVFLAGILKCGNRDEVCGLAIYEPKVVIVDARSVSGIFLYYFASARHHRSNGTRIGPKMYRYLVEQMAEQRVFGMALEISRNDAFADRRRKWYERQGAESVPPDDYVYTQDLGSEGHADDLPLRMDIMLHPNRDLEISDSQRREFLTEIFPTGSLVWHKT